MQSGSMFPQRAELSLSFVVPGSASCDQALSSGCHRLLGTMMERLARLQKPMHGLDMAREPLRVDCYGHQEDRRQLPFHSFSEFLVGLATCGPVQLCRGESNMLTLMRDGRRVSDDAIADQGAVDIARSLRFGILSPLLSAWRGRCIVISSMGKQSTGKSYFLNHLTGTSFATAGARCTDGAWMSVCELANGVMLVVLDFEGIGSFERSKQEDVFLSVLNAAVSMLTVFRMEMRLDKEFDELFSKFQQGSQLIPSDPQLFRGKLSLSVKDVNPHDIKEVVDEVHTKCGRLHRSCTDQNFLEGMYRGQLDIHCSPPLGTTEYYQSLTHVQRCIERDLCEKEALGFESGKAFLDYLRLILSKISILDWTSVDEGAVAVRVAEAMERLPQVIRLGPVVGDPSQAFQLNGGTLVVGFLTGNPQYASASAWRELVLQGVFDKLKDDHIDFGITGGEVNSTTVVAASRAIRALFQVVASFADGRALIDKSSQARFNAFLAFTVYRRCERVQAWSRQVFRDRAPDEWKATEERALWSLQIVLTRCSESCGSCLLGCMMSAANTLVGHTSHDCGTDHECPMDCDYCNSDGYRMCAKPAGHNGPCQCTGGDHICRGQCALAERSGCGKRCVLEMEHEGGHACDSRVHECGEACAAANCGRRCVVAISVPHTTHKCALDACVSPCVMDGCHRTCGSADHLHGVNDEAPVLHICDGAHSCPEICADSGICQLDVVLRKSTKTLAGARGSFQYTAQEMNGSRKRCVVELVPGSTAHDGPHSCLDRENVDEANIGHYCDVRCPCCSYYCQRDHGHEGKHKTTHGNMRSTVFLSDERNLDVLDRKYTVGERGTAEMCSLYCSKMGRGHVHYLDCGQGSLETCLYVDTTASVDQRRHCTRELAPAPEREQDEVLHERFWDALGWEDPCGSHEDREKFKLCSFRCDAPEHQDDDCPSYCVHPAWHAPVVRPSGGRAGYTFTSGHEFKCYHVAQGTKRHFVAVIELRHVAAHVQLFRHRLDERIAKGSTDDLVSVITFGASASIYCEGKSIIEFTSDDDNALCCSREHDVSALVPGLRIAKALLSRADSRVVRPALHLFSDTALPSHKVPKATKQLRSILRSLSIYQGSLSECGDGARAMSRPISTELGWVTVDDIDVIVHSASATDGAKSGLAVAPSFAEDSCVVCLLELVSEPAIVLLPCRHELHQRCFRAIPEGAAGRLCPTCRREVSNE